MFGLLHFGRSYTFGIRLGWSTSKKFLHYGTVLHFWISAFFEFLVVGAGSTFWGVLPPRDANVFNISTF